MLFSFTLNKLRRRSIRKHSQLTKLCYTYLYYHYHQNDIQNVLAWHERDNISWSVILTSNIVPCHSGLRSRRTAIQWKYIATTEFGNRYNENTRKPASGRWLALLTTWDHNQDRTTTRQGWTTLYEYRLAEGWYGGRGLTTMEIQQLPRRVKTIIWGQRGFDLS